MNRMKFQSELLNEIYNSPMTKFDYDSNNNMIYSGTCTEFNQPTCEKKWIVKRYWYDANGNLIKIKKQWGIWDERTTMDWGV